mgnify:CR=1 FL=1
MNKGKFIIFEGIDSCGKSTQIKLLQKKFSKYNIPIMFTREPSNGPIGRLIRREYLSGKRKENGGIINKLCEIDRMDHILNENNGISKNLKNGINVICDRYILSTIAYSLYNRIDLDEKLFSQKVIEIYNRFLDNQGLKPDLILHIKIDPKVAIDRISKRRGTISIYEDNISKLQKIDKSYNKSISILLKNQLCSIVTINGEDSKKNVLNDIWHHVTSVIDVNTEEVLNHEDS